MFNRHCYQPIIVRPLEPGIAFVTGVTAKYPAYGGFTF
jgi:hypothetical protein